MMEEDHYYKTGIEEERKRIYDIAFLFLLFLFGFGAIATIWIFGNEMTNISLIMVWVVSCLIFMTALIKLFKILHIENESNKSGKKIRIVLYVITLCLCTLIEVFHGLIIWLVCAVGNLNLG